MSTRAPKPESAELLIGESFDAPDARLYVYRDDGTGRTEGKYLKRYDARIELEDLKRDLGPGMYILLQNRGPGGGPVRRSVFVPADPQSATIESTPATSSTSRLDQLRELLEMRMIADQMAPRSPDPVKMLESILSLVRGTAPQDPLTAFLKGAEWDGRRVDENGDVDPAAMLTAAGVRLLEQRAAGAAAVAGDTIAPAIDAAATVKKVVSAFNQRFERTEKMIAALAARVQHNGDEPREDPPVSVSLLEIFQALTVGKYESGEHVAIVLKTMDKAARGDLRKEIESYELAELLEHMKRGLESAGHGERFEAFAEGIRLFLSR